LLTDISTGFQRFTALGGSEPKFTTYKKRAGGPAKIRCIDYIWFERERLELTSVLKLPTEDEIGRDIMLPNLRYKN
jgi:hypothetical protein